MMGSMMMQRCLLRTHCVDIVVIGCTSCSWWWMSSRAFSSRGLSWSRTCPNQLFLQQQTSLQRPCSVVAPRKSDSCEAFTSNPLCVLQKNWSDTGCLINPTSRNYDGSSFDFQQSFLFRSTSLTVSILCNTEFQLAAKLVSLKVAVIGY